MKAKNIILLILFIIIFVGVWNLLDLLYSAFITRSGYQFGIGEDLLLPLFIAIVIDIPLFAQKRNHDLSKNDEEEDTH